MKPCPAARICEDALNRAVCTFALLLSAGCAASFAQEPPRSGSGEPLVRASGEGIIGVKPDQAVIHIGVVTQASTAAAAALRNAAQATAVLVRMKGEIGPKGDIRTTGYSFSSGAIG